MQWSWHSSPRNILQGRQLPCRHSRISASQSESEECVPGSGENSILPRGWKDQEQSVSQQLWG